MKAPRKKKKIIKKELSSIPKYKIGELYSQVHDDIMHARLNITMLLKGKIDNKTENDLFNILSDLNCNCPQKAIDIFNKV